MEEGVSLRLEGGGGGAAAAGGRESEERKDEHQSRAMSDDERSDGGFLDASSSLSLSLLLRVRACGAPLPFCVRELVQVLSAARREGESACASSRARTSKKR